MGEHESYKYLGITQSQGIDNTEMKKQLIQQFLTLLKSIKRNYLRDTRLEPPTHILNRWLAIDLESLNGLRLILQTLTSTPNSELTTPKLEMHTSTSQKCCW